MAASPVEGDWKLSQAPSREGSTLSPEFSLTWCVAHLTKPSTVPEHQGQSKAEPGGRGGGGGGGGGGSSSREMDKKSRVSQWRALVAIRTQHIKGDKAGITRFRTQGGLRPLLELLRYPDCSRKTLDLALSILANCCTEPETRVEVRKLNGINIVVDIMKRNVALETVQNRAARALGNLAMDSESSALIHSAGGIPLLLLCLSLTSSPSSPTAALPKDPCPKLECAQSSARALLYLSDTPSNRLSLLTQGTLSALAPLIAPEYPQGLRRAALKTLHELTRGCGVECAREVSRSKVLAQLGVMATGESGKPFEEVALKTLANMCSQGCLRPLVGSLGAIQRFIEEVKRDPLKSGVFVKALCLCCKEAVNRAKVKESGGLEVLVGFLAAHQSHLLSRFVILACVDFVFDESAMEQLQELGLVPLLASRLVELTRGEEQSEEKMDVSTAASTFPAEPLSSSCFDSFDFPPPEGYKREEACREQGSSSFLSLRSWLVSEGLISSEGDLLDSSGSVDQEWASLQIQPSSSPHTSPLSSDFHSSLKNSLPSNTVTSSAAKKDAPPVCPTMSPSPTWKVTDVAPSSPQPLCGLASESQPSSSTLSSPTKTTHTPVSPTKFSSPHRRRQRAHSAVSLTKVSLDTPPSVPRAAAFQHPYHPEPWTSESPILLLLSRFSHATDPSAALVNSSTMSSLLFYLTQHQDPSSRCFRMLYRLSCNPNCLQAFFRTGSVALIHHLLCQKEGGVEGRERQTERVKAKVRQLGMTLLNNLHLQCESGFGAGVLAHVMLSGSECDRVNCALSLPLISSNKPLLKKLLLDCGSLLLALQTLGCDEDDLDDRPANCERLLSHWIGSSHSCPTVGLRPLYFSLLIGCLSALLGGIGSDPVKRRVGPCKADRAAPPPSKRPHLTDICPYGVSNFDLILLLDDGTRIPANREAVAGSGDAERAGSEYFQALLRGGFGEARIDAEEAIHIKDVSRGMLLPVLHYLHGCRFAELSEDGDEGEPREQCQILDKVLVEGLGISRRGTYERFAGDTIFQNTPLGEMMMGACRFLVTELQRELEDLCVSLLVSCSTRAAGQGAADDKAESAASKMDLDCSEEAPANRTAGSDLAAVEVQLGNLPGQTKKSDTSCRKSSSSGQLQKSKDSKSPSGEELNSRPKNWNPGEGTGGVALANLVPQVYWFSQQYSYQALGRSCLTLLLGCRDGPRPFGSSPSLAADCLRRVAREAHCTEALRGDILSLATAALS